MEHTMETAQGISGFTILKNLPYVAAFFVYINLDPTVMVILAVLMTFDTLTGIARNVILHGRSSFNTHALEFGIFKKLLFLTLPIVLSLAGKGVGMEVEVIATWSVKALIISEVISSIANIRSIQKRKEVKEFDVIGYILDTLQHLLEKIIRQSSTK